MYKQRRVGAYKRTANHTRIDGIGKVQIADLEPLI